MSLENEPSNDSEAIDWKAHAENLQKKLDKSREEQSKYEDALKRLVSTHQIASEEVELLKREVALRDDDIKYLWHEIKAFKHNIDSVNAWREHREKVIEHQAKQLENRERKLAYMDGIVARQDSIIKRLEKEIILRAQHFESLKQCQGWKVAKTISGKILGAPIDLSSLDPIPGDVPVPEYLDLPILAENPSIPAFDQVFEKDPSIAVGYRAALETPRSFASPAIGQTVKFSGWCCDQDGKAPVRIWAQVGEDDTPCAVGGLRQDVVDSLAETAAVDANIGFQGEISTGPGENFVSIYAEFADGSQALLFKRIVVNVGLETTPKRQLDDDYQSWIKNFDTLSVADIEAMKESIADFQQQPLISILLPVYNTEEKWLREVIESVQGQIYSNWELCIADDASSEPHVKTILQEYADRDERIKFVIREDNGHISAATNSALEIATGEFCALLDHDDLLPIHSLYWVANELNRFPESDLVFSDEDKIDCDGKRFDPYFKSDWNPDLFLSHNCISHLGVYRTAILREIDGFKEELYGSQDWDLALRFLLKTSPDKIRHIPRILYHWRYLETSTAKSIDTKPYALTAGKKAIENYLEARGREATVEEAMWPGAFRVKYQVKGDLKVSIIIPTRDQVEVTRQCIESVLEKTAYKNFEILVVDNQSELPETLSYFAELEANEQVTVLKYDAPFNFSAINNFAAKEALGDILVFLNNDVEVTDEGWLEELVSQASRDEVGVAGGWLLYPDHTVQHAGILMGVCGIAVEAYKHNLEWNIGHMGRAHLNQYYSAVTGACMATRKDLFLKLGGFNEDELAVAYNDVDYCLRVSRDAGLATVWTPYAKLIHHESVSRGYEVTPEQKARIERESSFMMEHWGHIIQRDPFYNPNLSKFSPVAELAWPPRTASC